MMRLGIIAALATGLMVVSSAAVAQVPEKIGFFGALDGRWMWLSGDRFKPDPNATSQTTSGPGGQLMLGYKFAPNWDMAVAGDIQPLLTEVTQTRAGTLTTDTTRQHVDIELGYSQDWWRLNGGLRGYHFLQRENYYFLPNGGAYDQREIFAVAPRSARVRVGQYRKTGRWSAASMPRCFTGPIRTQAPECCWVSAATRSSCHN